MWRNSCAAVPPTSGSITSELHKLKPEILLDQTSQRRLTHLHSNVFLVSMWQWISSQRLLSDTNNTNEYFERAAIVTDFIHFQARHNFIVKSRKPEACRSSPPDACARSFRDGRSGVWLAGEELLRANQSARCVGWQQETIYSPVGSRAALPVSVARDCDVTVRWLVEELVSLDQTLLLVRNLFSTWKDKSVIYVCDLSDNEALMLSYEMLENWNVWHKISHNSPPVSRSVQIKSHLIIKWLLTFWIVNAKQTFMEEGN